MSYKVQSPKKEKKKVNEEEEEEEVEVKEGMGENCKLKKV